MKKLLTVLISLLFLSISHVFANDPLPQFSQNPTARYRLFQTENTWIFLKLDTMTGKIWIVQFSVQGDEYRFESPLSITDIAENFCLQKIVGRYTLYPTRNTYNFIMVDQIDGDVFQVQWSLNGENNFILPIN